MEQGSRKRLFFYFHDVKTEVSIGCEAKRLKIRRKRRLELLEVPHRRVLRIAGIGCLRCVRRHRQLKNRNASRTKHAVHLFQDRFDIFARVMLKDGEAEKDVRAVVGDGEGPFVRAHPESSPRMFSFASRIISELASKPITSVNTRANHSACLPMPQP